MHSDIDKELDDLYDSVRELHDTIEKQVFISQMRLIEMEVKERRKRKLSANNLCRLIMDSFKKEK